MSNKNIYLVARYYLKPKPGVNTTVKGWMDDTNNIRYDEAVDIVRGLKKNVADSQVILNLSNKTVERNAWNDNKDFDRLFAYFFEGYHSYLTSVMKQLDPEYLSAMVDKMHSELEAIPAEATVVEQDTQEQQ